MMAASGAGAATIIVTNPLWLWVRRCNLQVNRLVERVAKGRIRCSSPSENEGRKTERCRLERQMFWYSVCFRRMIEVQQLPRLHKDVAKSMFFC
ncbi:hypothetical protein Leryth_001492 [Lithospermum erythrorhizon]|nr:hypothetical protein Leryth_001492 [Lithospermum erythrorhizon]